MTLLLITFASVWFSVLAGQAVAQDFDKGTEAFERRDFEAAVQEWGPLARAGNAAAQYGLGKVFQSLGNYEQALGWYRFAAAGMNADAQVLLGQIYSIPGGGFDVALDYVEAYQWTRLAAIQGHAAAHISLAVMYEHGRGVLQDYRKAHMWWNIAASNGTAEAAKFREDIAAEMTAEDISAAQAMASKCMSSGYGDCEW